MSQAFCSFLFLINCLFSIAKEASERLKDVRPKSEGDHASTAMDDCASTRLAGLRRSAVMIRTDSASGRSPLRGGAYEASDAGLVASTYVSGTELTAFKAEIKKKKTSIKCPPLSGAKKIHFHKKKLSQNHTSEIEAKDDQVPSRPLLRELEGTGSLRFEEAGRGRRPSKSVSEEGRKAQRAW